MNADAELQRAFTPLIERAKRRAERIKQLSTLPATPERDKAIASEQRELDLIKTTATATTQVLDKVVQFANEQAQQRNEVLSRVQDVAEDANRYEQLFFKTVLTTVPDPADEQWPPVAATAMRAIFRMQHLRNNPATYAASYPSPYRISTP